MNIIYPRFYKCSTIAKFNSLQANCCTLLNLPNTATNNYANPIVDKNGFNWIIVNPDVSSLFNEAEIAAMVQYNEIVL
jgi:hypothetical protein